MVISNSYVHAAYEHTNIFHTYLSDSIYSNTEDFQDFHHLHIHCHSCHDVILLLPFTIKTVYCDNAYNIHASFDAHN